MRAHASLLVRRGPGFVPLLLLAMWALAVLVAGLDMAVVWIGQLNGAGNQGDVYVAASERLMLLALFGALPPLLAWVGWRVFIAFARAVRSRPRSGAQPLERRAV